MTAGGPVVIRTAGAEFDLLASGYLEATLVRDGTRLTLDEPASVTESLVSGTNEIRDFILDLGHARVSDAKGKLGTLGKGVEVVGRSPSGVEKTLAVEVYDDFPSLALMTTAYKNVGQAELRLDQVVAQPHRLNASLADAQAQPYELWSFQGSSYEWGKDDVVKISRHFFQPNVMGAPTARGLGGGIPVEAFWTVAVGEAIGHLETLPLVLSMPVKTGGDGRINTSIVMEPKSTLKPGEVFSTPRSFVAVYRGDFYEPLRLYSKALQREGWTLPKPTNADYNISWCGWGYEFNVSPAQMLGTIPKLKEFHIKWATLDDRWFGNYGDWQPRQDTFPGDSIKKMVDGFHKEGTRVQIWWLPLGVEDGQARYESHRYQVSEVVKRHPDWLILDKSGKHARMVRSLAALCPALPEVQEYYRNVTERFIHDWGVDGHKLDNVYTVPACYNPKHHHKSPYDSINAIGEVYKVIFETTRAETRKHHTELPLRNASQPRLAALPGPGGHRRPRRVGPGSPAGQDVQSPARTASRRLRRPRRTDRDQVRQRPQRNRYGQGLRLHRGHRRCGGHQVRVARPGPHFKTVLLTPEKEAIWKKWTDIYNSKMLSRGTFLDLHVTGYDVPEGYAIEKDGELYYAFFAPDPAKPWKGEVELRGLPPGKFRVLDYENGKELGAVDSQSPRLATEFTHHLLPEASRQ